MCVVGGRLLQDSGSGPKKDLTRSLPCLEKWKMGTFIRTHGIDESFSPYTALCVQTLKVFAFDGGPSDLAAAPLMSPRDTSLNKIHAFCKLLKNNIQKRNKGELFGAPRPSSATLLGPQP